MSSTVQFVYHLFPRSHRESTELQWKQDLHHWRTDRAHRLLAILYYDDNYSDELCSILLLSSFLLVGRVWLICGFLEINNGTALVSYSLDTLQWCKKTSVFIVPLWTLMCLLLCLAGGSKCCLVERILKRSIPLAILLFVSAKIKLWWLIQSIWGIYVISTLYIYLMIIFMLNPSTEI